MQRRALAKVPSAGSLSMGDYISSSYPEWGSSPPFKFTNGKATGQGTCDNIEDGNIVATIELCCNPMPELLSPFKLCTRCWNSREKRGSIPRVVELQAATIRRGEVPTVATLYILYAR